MENTNYDENLEQNEVDNDYEPEIDEAEIDDTSSSKTISEVNKKKRSEVWNYFTKDENYKETKKAKCNHCGISYTCTDGSTSNLNKHIKNSHSGKIQEVSIKDIFDTAIKKVKNFLISYIFN